MLDKNWDQHSAQRTDYGQFHSEEFRERATAATELANAIARCDPDDACIIMSAALSDLSAGKPITPLLSIQSEAAEWACFATRFERKTYLLAIFRELSAADRSAFLNFAIKESDDV